MNEIQAHEVPYGTEVFIIVPDQHAEELRAAKERLIASLEREFPLFTFSLGRSASDGQDEFSVLGVAGTVGGGWRRSRPVKRLEKSDEKAIVSHLHRFVSGDVDAVN